MKENSTNNAVKAAEMIKMVDGGVYDRHCYWIALNTSSLISVRAEMNAFINADEQVPLTGELRDYYHGEMTFEMMLDNIPEVAPYQETQYMNKAQFEKNYGVYKFEKDFAFEYKDINPYNVYSDYQEMLEQISSIKGFDTLERCPASYDSYISMNTFANDVDVHFYDALSGAYKGSWHTAMQFAEAIHVAYRTALATMYEDNILMYQDWDYLYVVGSCDAENPFVTRFFKFLYDSLKDTMRIMNGSNYSFAVKRGDKVEHFKY